VRGEHQTTVSEQAQRTTVPCSTSQRTMRPSWPPVISTRPLRDQTAEVTGSLHARLPEHAQECLVQDGCRPRVQRSAAVRTCASRLAVSGRATEQSATTAAAPIMCTNLK